MRCDAGDDGKEKEDVKDCRGGKGKRRKTFSPVRPITSSRTLKNTDNHTKSIPTASPKHPDSNFLLHGASSAPLLPSNVFSEA